MRARSVSWVLVIAVVLVVAGCSGDSTSPTAPMVSSSMTSLSAGAGGPNGGNGGGRDKVDVCHIDEEGVFHLITVAEPAVPAHLGHGDGLPGEEAPGGGATLDEECNLVPLVNLVSYRFEFEVTIGRYFGTDSTIAAQLPSSGRTATGTLTYDPTVAGAGSSPTVYDMTPAGTRGISFEFDNGLVWSTNPSGSFDALVFDRTSGNDTVRFRSGSDALLPISGLTTDFIFLTFGGDSATISSEALPTSFNLIDWDNPNNVDLRAVDATNSEFRIFGRLTSLTLQ